MTWKQIKGYEDYEVSDTGLVRSLKRGKKRILRPGKKGDGYLAVGLRKDGKRKNIYVHRLVAEAFIPNPLGLETVNHRDENKLNNRVENLEWMSLADNNRYGTHDLRSALAKEKPVSQLDRQGNVVRQFPSLKEAGRRTGISQSRICQVCQGRRRYKTAGGYFWRYA